MGLKAVSRLIAGAVDYEEGTWVPTLGASSTDGAHTYAQNEGHYVRLGDFVWITATLSVASLDVTMRGEVAIKGLPYTSSIGTAGVPLAVSRAVNINLDTASGYSMVTATLKAGSNEIALREDGDNTAFSNLTEADFTNGITIIVSGSYPVT
jgi:hypothetical protein